MVYVNNKEELLGGRIGKIHKVQNTVIRPSNKWTKDIHFFLQFLHDKGADFVPKPYGITKNGEEILSFMPGEVFNYPLPEKFLKDSMLVSAAKLLLKFHNVSEAYLSELTNEEQWMLPVSSPIEVMCHGDFAPYNVTIVNDLATGIIDFDTLHPGSKLWDIVYAVYRWVPFERTQDFNSDKDFQEQLRKAKIFLDTYGVKSESRQIFVKVLINRLEALVDFMKSEANKGSRDFQLNIKEGHLQKYLNDHSYLKENELEILRGIQLIKS